MVLMRIIQMPLEHIIPKHLVQGFVPKTYPREGTEPTVKSTQSN